MAPNKKKTISLMELKGWESCSIMSSLLEALEIIKVQQITAVIKAVADLLILTNIPYCWLELKYLLIKIMQK